MTFEKQTPLGSHHPLLLWLSGNWAALLGAAMILLGSGWLLTYALIQNWINPLSRFMAALVLSLSIEGYGLYLLTLKNRRGSVYVALGSVGTLLSLWYCHTVFPILDDSSMLLIMMLVIVMIGSIAFKFRNQSLAIVLTVLALLIPLIIGMLETHFIKLMLYVYLVDCAALAFYFLKRWGWPLVIASLGTHLYQWLFWKPGEHSFIYFIPTLTFCLFFAPTTLLLLKSKRKLFLSVILIYSITLPSYFYMLHLTFVDALQRGILASLILILLKIAYDFFKLNMISRRAITVGYLLGLSCIYCIMEFTRRHLTIHSLSLAYFLEIGCGIVFAYYGLRSVKIAQQLSLLYVFPILGSLLSLFFDLSKELEFLTFFTGMLALGLTGLLLCHQIHLRVYVRFLFLLSGGFGLLTVWEGCTLSFTSSASARAVAFIIYTLIGLGVMIGTRRRWLYRSSLLLLIGVFARVFFIESSKMPLIQRSLLFLILGSLLLLSTFLKKRFRTS